MIRSISQIFLTEGDGSDLPVQLQHSVESVRRAFPQCSHTIYSNETLRAFIAQHYEDEVLETYDALRPLAYKADLGRLCLLNVIGGWYLDIAVTMQTGVNFGDDIDMLVFRDNPKYFPTSWACSNTVFYSTAQNKVLRTAINFIVRNRRESYYGISPLCPTGPHVFGEALAVHRGTPRHLFGDYLALTPTHENKNMAFVLPDGTILAWAKRAGPGDLSALGVRGSNNYVELWKARQVYLSNP